jgi:putative protease
MDNLIGQVTHYYSKIGVAVVKVEKGTLAVGETIKFKHGDKEFNQVVGSLEVERQPVGKIETGEEAGMKVNDHVKEGWQVFKVVE